MAKYSCRELHFSSKKEMRKYFNEHPNNMVISKKQYKRAVEFEMDKELKRERRKQQIIDRMYEEGQKFLRDAMEYYQTDSIAGVAKRMLEESMQALEESKIAANKVRNGEWLI